MNEGVAVRSRAAARPRAWLRGALRALALGASLAAAAASAATITVDSTADNGAGCTLRNAVDSSNDGTSHGTCTAGGSSNTIVVPAGTYTVNSPPINIYQHSVTFQGAGASSTIINAGLADHVFDNYDPGTPVVLSITWQDMTIENGNALSSGPTGFSDAGAIFIDALTNGTITNCVLTGNHAEGSGGAVENWGSLIVSGSTFSSNVSSGQGGAIRNIGTLQVSNSTFSGNSADSGGAIWHSSTGFNFAALNDTFANNSATTAGGAISADDSTSTGSVALGQVTVAFNSAGSGGGIYSKQATFSLERTVVASNTSGSGPDCGGSAAFTSGDYDVFSSLSGCTVSGTTTHNVVNASPLLSALANNGGPTQTVALMDTSPAIDIAPTCDTGADQRGVARPIGAACDAGAFEAPLPIDFSPATLPAAQVGVAYSQSFTGSNGVGPYTFAVTAGSLPAGLTLAPGGTLSGTATAGGSFSFTVTVTDTFSSRTGSRPYTFSVSPPTTIGLSPGSLPGGTFGSAYSQSVTASGGTAPYTYVVTAGALPSGVGLSSAGLISGTPLASGTFNFTVTATDSSTGTGPYTGSRAYTIVVAATVPGAPVIGVATAGDAQATVAFSAPGSQRRLRDHGLHRNVQSRRLHGLSGRDARPSR